MLEFEHKHANASVRTIYQILDKPSFINESKLSDVEITDALVNLEKLMEEKGIVVDYAADYEPRTKYRFITEELMEKEASDFAIPGMTTHYIYEEFHPNHALDIEKLANDFFRHWTDQSFNEYSFELAREMKLDNGSISSKAEFLSKLKYYGLETHRLNSSTESHLSVG